MSAHGDPSSQLGSDPGSSARKKCALGEAAVRPEVENPSGTPRAPGVSELRLDGTANAWCVRIPVAWDCGRLLRPDTDCMATGRPLPSEKEFSSLIIPQLLVHTTSVPIPHTTQFIPYTTPPISLF